MIGTNDIQFNEIYRSRFSQLSARILKRILKNNKQDPKLPIKKLFDVSNTLCVSVCSFHRILKLRPDVLQKFTDELCIEYSKSAKPLQLSDEDETFLSDGIQTVNVKFSDSIDAEKMETLYPGVVIGAICRKICEDTDEYIFVEDFILPGSTGNTSKISTDSLTFDENGSTIFISGLNFGSKNHKTCSVQVLKSLISRDIEFKLIENPITNVVLLGNVLDTDDKNDSNFEHGLAECDKFMSEIAKSAKLLVIPGKNDPVDIELPQSSLPDMLFPFCKEHLATGQIKFLTNPFCFNNSKKSYILSDGFNIDDMLTINTKDSEETTTNFNKKSLIVKTILKHGHFCTVTPELFPCKSMVSEDPLVINTKPNYYVFGSSEASITDDFDETDDINTHIIGVPCFSLSHQVVILDNNSGTIKSVKLPTC